MKIVVALLLVIFTAGNGFGQNATDEAGPDARKTAKMEKKMLDGMVKRIVKKFGPADLTDEQLAQLPEILKPKLKAYADAKKAVDATLSEDQVASLKEVYRQNRDQNLKGKQGWKAVQAALDGLGLSEEERKAYDDAKSKVNKVNQEAAILVMAILSDEQKAAMPVKGKGKSKKNTSDE